MAQLFLSVKVTLTIMEHKLYLIFQPLYYTLKRLADTEKVVSWKSKGLSIEKLTISTSTVTMIKEADSNKKCNFYFSKYKKYFYCF